MATNESYCARRLAIQEDEVFLAVGDEVAHRLNPRFEEDRRAGRAESLPDLLSRKGDRYRLREVKFRLDDKTVRKAVAQLASGAALLGEPADRLEIAVPLGPRPLKAREAVYLGASLGDGRYELRLDDAPIKIQHAAVTVVLL